MPFTRPLRRAWAYCAVGGATANWYGGLAPSKLGSGTTRSGLTTTGNRYAPAAWPLWRNGWLALDRHFDAIGACTSLFLPSIDPYLLRTFP